MVKGYVLFVWGSINLRSQQWNGLAVHCRFQRKENTNHELWLKFLGRGGGGVGNHSILEVQIIFLPQTNILLQRISIVLGGPCYGWPPLQEKKREETAKIEMKVRKKKLRFLFLVILIFFI